MPETKRYYQHEPVALYDSDGHALYDSNNSRLYSISITDVQEAVDKLEESFKSDFEQVKDFINENSDMVLDTLRDNFGDSKVIDCAELALDIFNSYPRFSELSDVFLKLLEILLCY
ncbi:hypothetical protein L8R80_11645 [Vibrio splendidus]|uniref:hypothetical protein n=1 Tax=Vibrio splendidus TaxID=29497 RepID=UPI00246824A0|nr:hypothetical protein [Vibrio splendidus]MDH5911633.1 hypothetical protein [Vibrio splendidus]MDH5911638.1 hypothetical protein [Vibrio splendidus]MDH5941930.1 hypothetical protein [Vibrio splendidus]MDH5985871.1 hypothetical protein [Vibrio splendidus]MDH5985876.1 hypothetical protein [Vibrio splendidus]